MGQRYLHFTDLEGAKAISESGELWQSSYGPQGAIFAVVEGSAFVPSVQMATKLGRAKTRNAVVVFETKYLPDYAMPEEVMWHLPKLPIKVVKLTIPNVAKNMLDDSIQQDQETELLKIPLHPAFNDVGEWTRMPEDFSPWIPGQDNKKYFSARDLFLETNDINHVRNFWKNNVVFESKLKFIIKNILSNVIG